MDLSEWREATNVPLTIIDGNGHNLYAGFDFEQSHAHPQYHDEFPDELLSYPTGQPASQSGGLGFAFFGNGDVSPHTQCEYGQCAVAGDPPWSMMGPNCSGLISEDLPVIDEHNIGGDEPGDPNFLAVDRTRLQSQTLLRANNSNRGDSRVIGRSRLSIPITTHELSIPLNDQNTPENIDDLFVGRCSGSLVHHEYAACDALFSPRIPHMDCPLTDPRWGSGYYSDDARLEIGSSYGLPEGDHSLYFGQPQEHSVISSNPFALSCPSQLGIQPDPQNTSNHVETPVMLQNQASVSVPTENNSPCHQNWSSQPRINDPFNSVSPVLFSPLSGAHEDASPPSRNCSVKSPSTTPFGTPQSNSLLLSWGSSPLSSGKTKKSPNHRSSPLDKVYALKDLSLQRDDHIRLPTKPSRGRRPLISPCEFGSTVLPMSDGSKQSCEFQPVPGGHAFDPNLHPNAEMVRLCGVTKTGKRKKLFICEVFGCGKCFRRSEHLKRHVRSIHTNDKPYDCPWSVCMKSFSRHDNLNQHLKVHRLEEGGEVLNGLHVSSDGVLRTDVDETVVHPLPNKLSDVSLFGSTRRSKIVRG